MLKNKLTIITGASTGIGKSLAEIYAHKGHSLLLIGRRENLLQQLQQNLKKINPTIEVHYLALDLATQEATSILEQYLNSHNLKFDLFFNNAGLGYYQKFATHTQLQMHQMLQLNITALTYLSHFCLNYWKTHSIQGHLVNVASIAAYVPIENYVIYSATKAYVKSFSLSLRSEIQREGIKISCVCPGGTHTDFFQTSGQSMTRNGEKMMMSSQECARIIYDGVKSNQSTIIPGFSNKLSVLFSKLLPEEFFVKISTKVFNYFMKNA